MSYSSRRAKRPFEFASKSSHSEIINDESVSTFLKRCHFPASADKVSVDGQSVLEIGKIGTNPISNVIAVDGGYSQVFVKKEFPSSAVAFIQLGALQFGISDLSDCTDKPFIDPCDIEKLKNIQRLKLTIPLKNIVVNCDSTLTNSVRKIIFEFFENEPQEDHLIETLKWFIYGEYAETRKVWHLASCPTCAAPKIALRYDDIRDYMFKCEHCSSQIYLTDVFRLHEAIDDEIGAAGILGYVTTLIEQIVIVHLIRIILKIRPSLLKEILFIKDGPLAYFGQTARMHEPMRCLIRYLLDNHALYMVGLEKSGAFVEHADEISRKLKSGTALLLNNDYIYKYIIPGNADPERPYGRTTYYGNKIIYKSHDDRLYVATMPTRDILTTPKEDDYPNLRVILNNLDVLKCDMYDSALIPVALANKLVSLSNHPSSVILEKFARSEIR